MSDARTDIIDSFEQYAEEHGLKFIWAIERRPDECLIVKFTRPETKQSLSYRVTNAELSAARSPEAIADNIIKMIEERI